MKTNTNADQKEESSIIKSHLKKMVFLYPTVKHHSKSLCHSLVRIELHEQIVGTTQPKAGILVFCFLSTGGYTLQIVAKIQEYDATKAAFIVMARYPHY